MPILPPCGAGRIFADKIGGFVMKIDDLFKNEGYEPTTSMDAIILEESYERMAQLIDEVMDLYHNAERIVEHDMAMREQSRKYLWAM